MNISLLAFLLFFQTGISEPENITWKESPHFSSRPSTQSIDAIVLHTTEGSFTSNGVVSWFQNPNSKVSSHFIVDYEGDIIQMVDIDKKAWHATYYNSRSIGIDFCGKANDPDTFNDLNMETMVELVAWLCFTYDIPVVHPSGDAYDYPNDNLDEPGIVAHGQVQPWNRTDPGPHFDWEGFIDAVQKKLSAINTLTAPTGLSTIEEEEGLTFSWDDTPGADLYQLDVAESSEDLASMSGSFQILYLGEESTYTWEGAASGSTYFWKVTAQNNFESASSTASTGTGTGNDNCSATIRERGTPLTFILLGIFLLMGTFALRGGSSLQ